MTFGEKMNEALGQLILQNLFIVILGVAFVLFCLDYYGRFVKVNKDTDNVNLVERYAWLKYYQKRGRNA